MVHFDNVVKKLLHSLHTFQQCMIGLDSCWASGDRNPPLDLNEFQVDAGIAADSVILYLGIFLDDIARLVLYAHDIEPTENLDSFSALKKKVAKDNRLVALRRLFDELGVLSWYDCMFPRGRGIRQRLVHYHDIIAFAGIGQKDDNRIEAVAHVWGEKSAAHSNIPSNVVELFRKVFAELFDWLDRLEPFLANELRGRFPDAEPGEFHWGVRFRVPVVFTSNPFTFPDDYLYLPVCEGSDQFW